MKFNEDARVKIPALLQLCKLGYTYLSLKNATWDTQTNIFPEIFKANVARLNPDLTAFDLDQLLKDISLELENEDLGRMFYKRLTSRSGVKLIDFENFESNAFNVVTELPCINDDEEFRPDITLLINGMPLAFIEVKIPNNREGILAERNRMNERFQNKKFRKFINITQLMVFSNNMPYDDADIEPLQGAFYAATAYKKPIFNYFREENADELQSLIGELTDEDENIILKDNNLVSIKDTPEFVTNKNPNSPTNSICTSLFSKPRLAYLLQYGLAYVNEFAGLEKHVMRYPQFFAAKAIEAKLDAGVKKGIIWHTQGSGKTALSYYATHRLTDYYQEKGVLAKFYFIVDRLDLLTQASREFEARGLKVNKISDKAAFAREIKSPMAIHNDTGVREITVVNIQKFKDDPDVVRNTDYDTNIQRVYFLDEVHRSYNPKGSFLANLKESDPNAVNIGLTGTPLLGKDYTSRSLFGDYIHKYYYNSSIKDHYTLRLIREEIKTEYKMALKETLDSIKVLKGKTKKKKLFAHPKYVAALLDYIIEDFEESRVRFGDNSIGAMVVCDSSEQARALYHQFIVKYGHVTEPDLLQAAESRAVYKNETKTDQKVKSATLILHDVETKEARKSAVEEFKEGKVDLLIVYNMLLTGFDAKRLKKLYLGRIVKSHNLLQTLTRVNRRYNDFRFGYVVDFANIEAEFDKTNKAYFDELQAELGDEMESYSNLFLTAEEMEAQINGIEEVLFRYDTLNAELFTQQINNIEDRATMLGIVKALNASRSLYNLIRLTGHYELLDKLDFRKLGQLATQAENRLNLINQKEALESGLDTTSILNIALEDVLFAFTKVSAEEMVLADAHNDLLRKTREALANNLDKHSPEFISLREELERLFKSKKLTEITKEEMEANMKALGSIYNKAKENDRINKLLQGKYLMDAKYARIHKRLMEKGEPTTSEKALFEALKDLKAEADDYILNNSRALVNEAYIERMMTRLIIEQFNKKHNIPINAENARYINKLVVREYLDEYNGRAA